MPAKKLPPIEVVMTIKKAVLISFFRSAAGHVESSGKLNKCCACQNMNAHQADKEDAQTTIVKSVVRRTLPRNSSEIPGSLCCAFSFAECHSSGSGTWRRIQYTINAGRIPTRKT